MMANARQSAVVGLVLLAMLFPLCSALRKHDETDVQYVPVVLWHGMGDTCCFPWSMGTMERWIQKALPGIYVYSVMVGNNIIEDEIAGFLGNVNDEIAQIAGKLAADENLTQGFNAVGFSQGGQFLRAYTEMYNDPHVFSLITMGGQHQGVYGIPDCLAPNVTLCEVARDLLDLGAYIPIVQEVSVQAQYWHDPLNEELYREKNIFLPNINNDGTFNQTYKDNMLSLDNFVMVQFMNDTVVIPRESEWFGFYAPGQDSEILPLEDSPLYVEDWLGLQELDNTGRLWQLSCPGNHLDFTEQYFMDNIIPFLNQTVSS